MAGSTILKFVGAAAVLMSIVTIGFLILGTIGRKKKIITKEMK